jgi:organic hydroperoxide reductase OsmC/OhrA
MARNAEGRLAIVEVVLSPHVTFAGTRIPSEQQHDTLHHAAHDACFIANSVRTEVRCRPTLGTA